MVTSDNLYLDRENLSKFELVKYFFFNISIKVIQFKKSNHINRTFACLFRKMCFRSDASKSYQFKTKEHNIIFY